MTSLEHKIVLITGAGGGFGTELTKQLLAVNNQLILADLRTDNLPQDARSIAPTGKILGHIAADLSDPTGSETVYTESKKLAPHVDILINNAGIALYGLYSDMPQAEWERLMQINLLAPMRLTAHFLPDMIQRRSGHIVNLSSVAGLIGAPGMSAYSASKYGLRGFGESLAVDVRQYGVRVTNVYPFFARTHILDAPRFGDRQTTPIPQPLVYEPETVIRALVQGVRRNKLRVYPGAIPRWIDLIQRLTPWLVQPVARVLSRS